MVDRLISSTRRGFLQSIVDRASGEREHAARIADLAWDRKDFAAYYRLSARMQKLRHREEQARKALGG